MKKLLLLLPLILLGGCGGRHCYEGDDITMLFDESRLVDPAKPITIFVHGGARPASSILAIPGFYTACPRGFVAYKNLGCGCSTGRKIADELHNVDEDQFPLESFYVYGWSALLSFGVRRREGRLLYKILRSIKDNPRYKDTPMTIFTHSYGGQVALNIAQGAMEHNDERPLIDRLILTATPIVIGSQELVESPIFKKIYYLFSKSDFVQVLDPQFIYPISSRKSRCAPIFSKRRFDHTPNLIQAEVKINNRSATGHVGFVNHAFLSHVPQIIDFLDDDIKRSMLTKDKYGCYCININTYSGQVGKCQAPKECLFKKKVKPDCQETDEPEEQELEH